MNRITGIHVVKLNKQRMNQAFKFHGGDVQGKQILTLPEGAIKIENTPVAYGETSGHCHILTGDVELFEYKGRKYAVVGSDGAFHSHVHESSITPAIWKENRNLSNADHTKECWIAPGTYQLGIHKKYNPFQKVWDKVKD